MRFNTHCHIFNLQSVFDDATANILQNRLEAGLRKAVPGPLSGPIMDKLSDEIARRIVAKLKWFVVHGGGFDHGTWDVSEFLPYVMPGMFDLLPHVEKIMEALHLAMMKDMDLVTKDMMDQLDQDVIITPLMMDILIEKQGGPTPGDCFDAQIAGTQRQILNYPGRILPFYAVNPFRVNFVSRAVNALEQNGFVGVKLYPSVGYTLDMPGMADVFSYCDDHDIPMLMHCNHGGFKQNDQTALSCDPAKWKSILNTCKKLKICFGHFGGSENFKGAQPPADTWSGVILSLMKAFPGRVFADVSYHEEALALPATAPYQEYFRSLAAIMADSAYKSQVLWGSDTWLVRMACDEKTYWKAFTEKNAFLPPEAFKLMCKDNPRAFLGLDAVAPRENIHNFMNFMMRPNPASNWAGWSPTDAQNWLNAAT